MMQRPLLLLLLMGFLSTTGDDIGVGIGIANAESTRHNSSVQKLSGSWPRLFFDASERQQIETQRQSTSSELSRMPPPIVPTVPAMEHHDADLQSPPLITSIELQGISVTAKGRSAWLNGETVRSGAFYGGWKVDVEDFYVRLSASQQQTVLLRPGEKFDLNQTQNLDLVPTGGYSLGSDARFFDKKSRNK